MICFLFILLSIRKFDNRLNSVICEISIESDSTRSSRYTNAIHNIYSCGIGKINCHSDIRYFLEHHFQKISREFLAETLEKLAIDYRAPISLNDGGWYTLKFTLNKAETIDFMQSIENAGKGLLI